MMIEFRRDIARFGLPLQSVLLLLMFQLGGTAMELVGLAAIVPVYQFIQAEGNVAQLVRENEWWQGLIDAYAFFGLMPSLGLLLITSMLALLIRQGFVFTRLRFQAELREGLIAKKRAEGFSDYIAATTEYQEGQDPGRIVNDLTTELGRAVQYLFSSISLIGIGIIFTIYLVALVSISAALTALAVLVFGLAALAVRGQLHRTEKASREVVQANQNMSGFLVERIKTTRLIRLAGMERAEVAAMNRLTERQRSRMVRIFNLLANLEIIVEPIVVTAALAFLYVSITFAKLPLEFVGLFLVLIIRLLPVLKQAARTRQSKRGLKASFIAVADRFDSMKSEREHVSGTLLLTSTEKGIVFDDVVFAYEGRQHAPALDNLSCSFEAGQLTAIIGPSGAGKSTLFDMIPRLRRSTSGRILINGIDIGEYDLTSLRSRISYAPQSPQVFNVPLSAHIRYGKPDATMDEIRKAAELANAADFIDAQPMGYETLAGANGDQLSGGQKQRLDLARALVRGAPILLLDEPTSNLDADSEALFREALLRIRSETEMTILIIAHRLSTVMAADKIVVLQHGKVTAEGTHSTLIAQDEWYASAFAKQSGQAVNVALTA